tara:strand:- start:393 stop:563 length:171 start_codon:yes stop_codon:yes gene_type:complete
MSTDSFDVLIIEELRRKQIELHITERPFLQLEIEDYKEDYKEDVKKEPRRVIIIDI